MSIVDVHQHLWPDALIDALAARDRPPRLRGGVLETSAGAGEIDVDDYRLEPRLAVLDRLGVERAVVSLSPTLGYEDLPEEEARELAGAYEEGIVELAAAANGRIVPLAAGAGFDGFAGLCIGAPRLRELDGVAPILDEASSRGLLVFVHPGPAAPRDEAPNWWGAVVDQTAQLQAAYATWLAEGIVRWPALRIVFASLAGGGPFQLERLRSWGVAGRDVLHETVFFETSSYGNRALELCLSTFGVGQLLFGTDTPVLDPEQGLNTVRAFGDAVFDTLCNQNPARLLG